MEGDKNKRLVPDPQFDRLIPKPSGKVEVIKRNARLEDTIAFLPQAVKKVAWQVKKIAPLLKGRTIEETCRKIWERFYTRIQYRKDEPNKEQIKSPRVTWWLRQGDCDDFTVLVSSVLYILGIPHLFRIMAQTEANGYQHIYPVAITPEGKEIVIDCVVARFNYEVPYIKKIDREMELQFLDGIDDEELFAAANNIDAEDLLYGNLGELGKRFKDTKFFKKVTQVANKAKDKAKAVLHNVNKVNPATALLRAGVLASMKLNVFNIAGTLRYTYLNEAQAKQKGFNMGKFPRLRNIRERLEKIFHTAGGEIPNLKKAILEGKGNQNREVPLSGLAYAGAYSEATELPQLLGPASYREELMCAKDMGSLGAEPTTSAALAAATTAMAAIAALIKQLGPLREAGAEESPSAGEPRTTTAETADTATPGSSDEIQLPGAGDANQNQTTSTNTSTTDTDQHLPAKSGSRTGSDTESQGFLDRAKTWLKENKNTAIGIASATLAAAILIGGITYARKRKKERKHTQLSGVKSRKAHTITIQRLR